MSKYGLQLRGPQKKQPTKPSIFADQDDDDVEKEISRHATKNKSLKDIEEQHKKALEEDPSVFDYDGAYDEVKENARRPVAVDRQERKPRYIQALMDKAKQRQREQEIVYEKKIAKERGKEDHLFEDKDKFVTAAYKKKLAENQKWMEEERIRNLKEERDDVTKKKDITDFYFNLSKNVAFGAEDAQKKKPELKQQKDESIRSASEERHPPLEPNLELTKSEEREPEERIRSNTKVVSDAPRQTKVAEQPLAPEGKSDHHKKSSEEPKPSVAAEEEEEAKGGNRQKRGLDAVAAAKERFLARKKAKDQKMFEAAANAPL